MKYFEFTEPHYMLIQSNRESKAIEIYNHCIGNVEGNPKVKELTKNEAVQKLLDYENNEDRILLVDSSLL